MTPRDMSAPNWARTVKRARKLAAELRALDCQVIEPPNFETPPARRLRSGGVIVTGVAVILGEHGPETLVDRAGRPL